jgi:hypothetical protein
MKLLYITPLLVLFSCTINKSIVTNSKKDNIKEIVVKKDELAIKYANTITTAELKEHLYVLASDKYKGRETGKEGQKMAAEYISNEFINDGISPGNNGSYFQDFDLVELLTPNATVTIKSEDFFFFKSFFFYPSYMSSESFTVNNNDVIDLEYGIESKEFDNYENKNIEGKLVVIKNTVPKGISSIKWNWRNKLKIAQDKGAKAIFFVEDDYETKAEQVAHFFNKPSMKLKDTSITNRDEFIPFFFISKEMYKKLTSKEYLSGDNTEQIIIKIKQNKQELTSNNILGFIEGSDDKLKNEVIIITAHYDHIGVSNGEVFNGADDDGSGTVALLELAEAFQKAKNEGNGAKRSILIMPVSGEEKGLLGSSYYSSNPIYPLENTVVDLNIDMIGRLDSAHLNNENYVYLIGSDKISNDLYTISEAVNKTYTNIELDYTYNNENDPNRYYYRSDHYNFAKKGIPVIFYFNGVHADYHKSTDTVDKILFDKVEKITRLVFHTAWEIANRKTRLVID